RLNVAPMLGMIQAAAMGNGRAVAPDGVMFKKADVALAPPAAPAAALDRLQIPVNTAKDEVDNEQRFQGVLGGVAGKFVAGEAKALARENVVPANVLTVREYAHALRPNWSEGSRVDFTETVYWNAGVKTDASTGLATVSFNLSDSVTSFRVLADGF